MTGQLGKVILVAGGKGGVGKTTTAAGIAFGLVAGGAQVGLLDADLSGPSVPTLLGVSGPVPVIDRAMRPVPATDGDYTIATMSTGYFGAQDKAFVWHGPLVRGALWQFLHDTDWGRLDYLVIDTPPGSTDVHVALLDAVAPDVGVMVTTAHPLAIADTRRSLEFFRAHVPVVAIVENMSTFRCSCCGAEESVFPAAAPLDDGAEPFVVPFVPGCDRPWRTDPVAGAEYERLTKHLARTLEP